MSRWADVFIPMSCAAGLAVARRPTQTARRTGRAQASTKRSTPRRVCPSAAFPGAASTSCGCSVRRSGRCASPTRQRRSGRGSITRATEIGIGMIQRTRSQRLARLRCSHRRRCAARDALPAGPTDHYQERQLHLFLSGVDTFYYFVRAWLPRAIVVCSDRGRE